MIRNYTTFFNNCIIETALRSINFVNQKQSKMEKIVLKTDLSCQHCVRKVEPVLKSENGIVDYSIDLEHPDKLVTISSEGLNIQNLIANFKEAGYKAEQVE